jgi:hypothetical protein
VLFFGLPRRILTALGLPFLLVGFLQHPLEQAVKHNPLVTRLGEHAHQIAATGLELPIGPTDPLSRQLEHQPVGGERVAAADALASKQGESEDVALLCTNQ